MPEIAPLGLAQNAGRKIGTAKQLREQKKQLNAHDDLSRMTTPRNKITRIGPNAYKVKSNQHMARVSKAPDARACCAGVLGVRADPISLSAGSIEDA